jgi:hypothetical protein
MIGDGRHPTQAERKRYQDYKKKYGTIKVDGKKFEMDGGSPYRTKALATKAAQRIRKGGNRAIVRVGKNTAGKRVYRVYRGPHLKVNYKMLGF